MELNELEWNYHQPDFLMDHAPELPVDFMKKGPWSGHRRFAYDLVRFFKPDCFVELGTHFGTSFFSFCQGVRDGNLATSCYAIDNWKGDPHAGFYGESVFKSVKAVQAREFPGIATLIRAEFDHALFMFEDESIDLLHIDGYHTYEAANHDYLTWYPKLKENSIVLFHDTAVRIRDYEVHRLWSELKIHPHFEFPHSNGLGVLFPKGVPEHFKLLFERKELLINYYSSSK